MPTALVTGANSGIGLATALHFAEKGYRVFAGARRPETMAAHANIVPLRLDVDSDAIVHEAVKHVLDEAGAIDVLVNNAGIGMAGAVENAPMATIRGVFETNFFGAVRMIQAVMPSMRERRSGAIVNVTSIMGHVTFGFHGYYAATKHALAAVSETLAVEASPFHVRVAIIEPGVILTPIWGKAEAETPTEHPYAQVQARLWRSFTAQLAGGTMADVVARAIDHAVHTDQPKLRYAVGADAEVIAAARDRMTSAEWVAFQTEKDDAKFVAKAVEVFGVDLYNPPSLHARQKS